MWKVEAAMFLSFWDIQTDLQRRPQVQFLNLLFFIPKWQKAILRTPLGTSKLLSRTLFNGALTDIYAYIKSLHTQFQSRPIVEASEPFYIDAFMFKREAILCPSVLSACNKVVKQACCEEKPNWSFEQIVFLKDFNHISHCQAICYCDILLADSLKIFIVK